jgi:hypothetical protein
VVLAFPVVWGKKVGRGGTTEHRSYPCTQVQLLENPCEFFANLSDKLREIHALCSATLCFRHMLSYLVGELELQYGGGG